MRIRALVRRGLKMLLYFAAFVVLLSIGLRIYSAWQIPKAKRLLSELSQIRIGQPADDSVRGMLRKHNFEPDNSCADSDCYETEIRGAAPVAYDATWSNRMRWLLHHGFFELGLRPWWLMARIRSANGYITSVGYVLIMADATPIGISGSASHTIWEPELRSTIGDFSVRESRKHGDRDISVYLTSRVGQDLVASAFQPQASCVWRLRPCETAWDLYPQFLDYKRLP
jgi:hypothetical protein